jgi:L,D-transpeptidase ErfK/SrfK
MPSARTGVAVIAALALMAAAGCARRLPRTSVTPAPEKIDWTEALFARKPDAVFTLDAPRAKGTPSDTVVGRVQRYRVRPGDTFLDIARYYGLGYQDMIAANPGIDPWIPKAGTYLRLPTAYVLPCCRYRGVVINIPELRLYYYQRVKGQPDRLQVRTYPVGLGRDDRPTPQGSYQVVAKTENPRWVIPESIRQEHIRERGDPRYAIPGGAPDNPLGHYRLRLSRPRYAIHGTNMPWGVGQQVSHGCIRLYPEDIARLYPAVPVGTPVELTYQPVKVGRWGGKTFVEVHPDIYGHSKSLRRSASQALARTKLGGGVEAEVMKAALAEPSGVPVRVSGADAADGSVAASR